MSEQEKQKPTEENENLKGSDSLTDESSNTPKIDLESKLESEESKPLNLDDDDESSKQEEANKAKEQRAKQVERWSEKYYSGEVQLDEVPKWIQKEINKADNSDDFDSKFEQKMQKLKEEDKYSELKTKLNSLKLDSKQVDSLTKEYKILVKEGLSKSKALELAQKLSGISFEEKSSSSRVGTPKTSGKEMYEDPNESYSEKRKGMGEKEKRELLSKELGL